MPEPDRDSGGTHAGDRRFLTFRLGERLYALPAEEVAEVIRVPGIARVPMAPKALLGVANRRGAVLPVASGRILLGLETLAECAASRAIVLDGAAPSALTVDAVVGMASVSAERIETLQAELAASPGERLRGAFKLESGEEAVRVLDVQSLLAAAFTPLPRVAGGGRLLASATDRLHEADDETRRMLVAFEVAGQDYALPLEAIREIVPPPQDLAQVPRSEALVLGVAAYRETLLPILSLRGLLGFPPTAEHARQKVVVVALGAALVGLLVDRMRAVVAAEPQRIEPAPVVLAARAGGETRIRDIYCEPGGRRLISILAPEQLFREDVMQRLTEAAGPSPDAEASAEAPAEAPVRFLAFGLGGDEFALPVEAVEEVARAPERVTRVPGAPAFLEGVMNLRGEVLPVIDQGARFGMAPTAARAAQRLLVVRTQAHRAGLIVDKVTEVLTCSSAAIEPAPALAGETARLVQGVINLEAAARMVLVLDPAELLTRTERGLLDAFAAESPQADP